MTIHALGYDPTDAARRSRRRRMGRRVVFALGILLAIVLVPSVAIRQDETRMDAVTGSTTSQTVWIFRGPSRPRVTVSPIEQRLRAAGVTWTPAWTFIHATGHDTLGLVTSRSCGSAPPVYDLRPAWDDFAAASTDAELVAFVREMESGDPNRQQIAVDAAIDKAFSEIESSASTRLPDGAVVAPSLAR